MPGFRSHYFFGKNTFDKLCDNGLPECVKLHPTVFYLGEQGPDIFFYSPQAHVCYKGNIGMMMHGRNVNKIFEGLLKARKKLLKSSAPSEDIDIADAYILGFFGHYTLDTHCHPYISWRQEKLKYAGRFTESFGVHVLLETDIDNDNVHHFLNKKPSEFNHYDTIKVTKHERDVVAHVLKVAIDFAFPDHGQKEKHIRSAITFSRTLFHMITDKSGWKKSFGEGFDRLFFKHIFLSSVILNDDRHTYDDPCNENHETWVNPWDESISSDKDFYQLMDDAMEVYIRRIEKYKCFMGKDGDDREIASDLLADLGDNSYDSGLDWEKTLEISKAAGL